MKQIFPAAAVAACLIAAPASASVTFAQFSQLNVGAPTIDYTNTGAGTSTFSGTAPPASCSLAAPPCRPAW